MRSKKSISVYLSKRTKSDRLLLLVSFFTITGLRGVRESVGGSTLAPQCPSADDNN